MMIKTGRALVWPLVLLLFTYLGSTVNAFPFPTPVCNDGISACVTVSSTATTQTFASVTGSPTSSDNDSLTVLSTPVFTKSYTSSTPFPTSSSNSAAVTPVIRQAAAATPSDGRLTRTYDDEQQQPHETDNQQHREGSSKNPPALAFIGLSNDDNHNHNGTFSDFQRARLVRDDFESESFEQQSFFGGSAKHSRSRYRARLVASPNVRRIKEFVIRPYGGRYAVDVGLSEVPLGWTPFDDAVEAEAQTAKMKAAREADEAAAQLLQQRAIDMDELEKNRVIGHAVATKQQEDEHRALMQRLQKDNDAAASRRQQEDDEAHSRRRQEHEAALAKADAKTAEAIEAVAKANKAAERWNRAQVAADEEKEKYQHLVKVGNILLKQARREYRRASMLAPLVLCFLVVALSVLALVVFTYGRLKPVKHRSRDGKQSFRGPSQPPDDPPPPPDHPSPPTNDDTLLEDNVAPQADETAPRFEDSCPSPQHDDATPPPQDAASPCRDEDAAPSDDLAPSTDRGEQQMQEEAVQLDINKSSKAISHRFFVNVLHRKAKQRRDRTSAAARFSASLKKTHSASSEPAAPCDNPVPFVLVKPSESGSLSSAESSDDSLSVNLKSVIESDSGSAPVTVSIGVQTDTNDVPDSVNEESASKSNAPAPESPVELVSASAPSTCSIGVQTNAASLEFTMANQVETGPQAYSVAVQSDEVEAWALGAEEWMHLDETPALESSVQTVPASIPETCYSAERAEEDNGQPLPVEEEEFTSTNDAPALESSVVLTPTSCPVAIQNGEVDAPVSEYEGHTSLLDTVVNSLTSTGSFLPDDGQLAVLADETTTITILRVDDDDDGIPRSTIVGLNDIESGNGLGRDAPSAVGPKARPSVLETETTPSIHKSSADADSWSTFDAGASPEVVVFTAEPPSKGVIRKKELDPASASGVTPPPSTATPASDEGGRSRALALPPASSLSGFGGTSSSLFGSNVALREPVRPATGERFAFNASAFGLARPETATPASSGSSFGAGTVSNGDGSNQTALQAVMSGLVPRSDIPTVSPGTNSTKPSHPSIAEPPRNLDSSRRANSGSGTKEKKAIDDALSAAPVIRERKVIGTELVNQPAPRPACPPTSVPVPKLLPAPAFPEAQRSLDSSRWSTFGPKILAKKVNDARPAGSVLQERKANAPAFVDKAALTPARMSSSVAVVAALPAPVAAQAPRSPDSSKWSNAAPKTKSEKSTDNATRAARVNQERKGIAPATSEQTATKPILPPSKSIAPPARQDGPNVAQQRRPHDNATSSNDSSTRARAPRPPSHILPHNPANWHPDGTKKTSRGRRGGEKEKLKREARTACLAAGEVVGAESEGG